MKTSFSAFTAILSLSLLLFLSLPSPSLAAAKCNADDKKALLQIKAGLNNPYYLASWNPSTDCCSWYALDCDSKTGRVIHITIFDDNKVSAQIPAAIGNLPYLEMLDMNRLPNLVGPIPSSISRLTRLNFLRLKSNGLSGPVPSFLGQIKSLTFLDLSFNQFSGSIPPSLTRLNLQGFDVSHNNLCGQIPQGGKLQSFASSAYDHNKCLCGSPLPAC
ncbi:polygalacturonase inhibitor 1-like [Coffea arabica]|uniref:Polygalacturonase inhibitor 1-like n=1 Tax=Coffea arabica TaxID=13443 RepID=A0A6P6SI19_COFAR|nr:polygalacturonase inhibitor-like [Coffea arabica]